MKKFVIAFAVLLGTLMPVSAAASPSLPGAGYITPQTVKLSTMGAYWRQSSGNQDVLCTGFYFKRKRTVRILAQPIARKGFWPQRNIRKGVKQALRTVC